MGDPVDNHPSIYYIFKKYLPDGSKTSKQGLILNIDLPSGDPAPIVFHLNGTGSAGATIHMFGTVWKGLFETWHLGSSGITGASGGSTAISEDGGHYWKGFSYSDYIAVLSTYKKLRWTFLLVETIKCVCLGVWAVGIRKYFTFEWSITTCNKVSQKYFTWILHKCK